MTTVTGTELSTGSVVSADGTQIGYLRTGHGPAVLLLHGSMESSRSHLQMAAALAEEFTVYLPDRRGRGMSGPYPAEYGIRTEVEDQGGFRLAVLVGSELHHPRPEWEFLAVDAAPAFAQREPGVAD